MRPIRSNDPPERLSSRNAGQGVWRNRATLLLSVFFCAWWAASGLCAESPFSHKGQLGTWLTGFRDNGQWEEAGVLRYLPEAAFIYPIAEETRLGAELSFDAVLRAESHGGATTSDVDLYRATMWLATPHTETVLGLQKIAFGPARLLRPLQWFDQLDPVDPLSFTRGVYGLQLRLFADNTANTWVWCLYGNDDPKGYETQPTLSTTPEWGGRLQLAAGAGEMGLTMHWRRADGSRLHLDDYQEQRLALDGRWDFAVGVWFEAVWQHAAAPEMLDRWQNIVVVGSDYTLDWGNGLYALVEQMAVAAADEWWGWRSQRWVTAVMLDYPLNALDRLKFFGLADWRSGRVSTYLTWQRTYDNLVMSCGLFDYPTVGQAGPGQEQQRVLTGTGLLLMAIYTY